MATVKRKNPPDKTKRNLDALENRINKQIDLLKQAVLGGKSALAKIERSLRRDR